MVKEKKCKINNQEQFWQHAYSGRDVNHPVVRLFALQRMELIRKYIPLEKVKKALDVRCGSGFSTFLMAQFIPTVFGVDLSSFMLKRNPLPPSRLVQADARALPFLDESFDLVYCWELLHHFENPLPILKEMARVSKRWIVIFEPCRYHPVQLALALVQKEHRPILHFSSSFLERLIQRVGLNLVVIKRVGWLFPNKTPSFLLPILGRFPVETRLGISYFVVAKK